MDIIQNYKRLKQLNYLTAQKNNTQNKKWRKGAVVVEVILINCNLVDNQYQQKFGVLWTFTPYKSFAYLSNTEPSNLVFLKTYNTKFDEILVIFTDQNGRPLKIEDKVNLTLLINKKK